MWNSAVCDVHQETLQNEAVPIRYGLIRFSKEFLEAQQRLFPNSRSFVLGGCRVGPGQPKTKELRYCPQCRLAEHAWAQDHSVYANGKR
jgi:hypothetical protein